MRHSGSRSFIFLFYFKLVYNDHNDGSIVSKQLSQRKSGMLWEELALRNLED